LSGNEKKWGTRGGSRRKNNVHESHQRGETWGGKEKENKVNTARCEKRGRQGKNPLITPLPENPPLKKNRKLGGKGGGDMGSVPAAHVRKNVHGEIKTRQTRARSRTGVARMTWGTKQESRRKGGEGTACTSNRNMGPNQTGHPGRLERDSKTIATGINSKGRDGQKSDTQQLNN